MKSSTSLPSERLEDSSGGAAAVNQDSTVGRGEHLWLLAIAVAAIAGSFVLYPGTKGGLCFDVPGFTNAMQLPEVCMSRLVLGISCPGCGLTRSFSATARGDLVAAWNLNPMGPVFFLLCLAQIPYRIVEYFGLYSKNTAWVWLRNHSDLVMYLVIAGLFTQWVVRLLL